MIPKEHGEELEKRRKRRYSNHYADLWSIVLVIALLIFCKIIHSIHLHQDGLILEFRKIK